MLVPDLRIFSTGFITPIAKRHVKVLDPDGFFIIPEKFKISYIRNDLKEDLRAPVPHINLQFMFTVLNVSLKSITNRFVKLSLRLSKLLLYDHGYELLVSKVGWLLATSHNVPIVNTGC